MDRSETLNLYNAGHEAWNVWARKQLEEKETLEKSGASLDAWLTMARADFEGAEFRKGGVLADLIFPADVSFRGAGFLTNVHFQRARFCGRADFRTARFRGDAAFDGARFEQEATFFGARFEQQARFCQSTFSGKADFREGHFERPPNFGEAQFAEGVDLSSGAFRGGCEFSDAEARKGFTFSRAECYGLADFSRAQLTNSDFNGTVFKKPARFKEVLFHEASDFVGTKFSSEATFTQAKFYGNSDFNDAEFDSGAFFAHSHFQGDAWFKEAKFLGEALFDSAIFARSVHFMQTRFSSFTSFGECRFHVASFAAVRAESAFDLTNAHFDEVPNFNQAHFLEAPRLDNISVPTVPEVRSAKVPVGPDFAARYRALKRLAIQSHDHDRELQFFADELRSQRGDPWSARSLFIAAYRILSDFGRSITRPLLWWIGTTALFAGIYAGLHNSEPSSPLCQGSKSDSLAIYLSLRRGLVLPALGQGQELDRVYGCLFGTAKLTAESGERVISNIPDIAAYAGIVQTLFSTVLIFLFLLAIRNHFRIK